MYRIVISIIRGTNAGRALSLMASGLQCEGDTLVKAHQHFDNYMDCAHPILAAADADTCFGMASILNTKTGVIETSEVLMGKATVVRVATGTKGSLPSERRSAQCTFCKKSFVCQSEADTHEMGCKHSVV